MKKIAKIIICIFAVFGLLMVVATIIEPYYFKLMTGMIPSNIRDRSGLKDIVEYNFGNVDEVEFLQGETFLKNGDRIKIDNNELYKLEFIDGEIDTGRINLACYNPEFSTFLSLPQYALFAILKFNKKTCYYIGSTLYGKEGECEYIPTQRFNYAGMYPYSIISVGGNIQLKMSYIPHYQR